MSINYQDALKNLIPTLSGGRLAILAGSGISVAPPSSLPTWNEFIKQFIDFCENVIYQYVNTIDPPQAAEFHILLDACRSQLTKDPARINSVLKRDLDKLQKQYGLQNLYKNWINSTLFSSTPNNYHELIIETDYPFILTTNYDTLLEGAAQNKGYFKLTLETFDYKSTERFAVALYNKQSSIVHIHGAVTSPSLDDLILTSEDYIAIRRKHPGFRMALHSLFATHSVLFVGYGASDPHLEDLLDEIADNLSYSSNSNLPRYYLVLHETEINLVLEKYKSARGIQLISVKDYNEVKDLLTELRNSSPRRP